MLGNGVFAPHRSVIQVGQALDVIMLGLDDAVIEKVAAATNDGKSTPALVRPYAPLFQPITPSASLERNFVPLRKELALDDTKNMSDTIAAGEGAAESRVSAASRYAGSGDRFTQV